MQLRTTNSNNPPDLSLINRKENQYQIYGIMALVNRIRQLVTNKIQTDAKTSYKQMHSEMSNKYNEMSEQLSDICGCRMFLNIVPISLAALKPAKTIRNERK